MVVWLVDLLVAASVVSTGDDSAALLAAQLALMTVAEWVGYLAALTIVRMVVSMAVVKVAPWVLVMVA